MSQMKRVKVVVRAVALAVVTMGSMGCAAEVGTAEQTANAEDGEAEQPGTHQEALSNAEAIEYSYQFVFGRSAEPFEVQYWLPRFTTTEAMIRSNKAWFQSNQAERRATIGRAYSRVYKRTASSNELNSWDSYVIGRDYGFTTLCGKLEEYARNIGFSPTGTYQMRDWSNLFGFTLYTGRTYNVPRG